VPTEPAAAPQESIPVASDGPRREFIDIDPSDLTVDELVGMWSNDENCARPIVYNADGTYTDYTGVSGRWTLENESLTRTGGGRTISDHVDPLDTDTVALGEEDGLVAMLMRCRGG
jgi:hypothetical protein